MDNKRTGAFISERRKELSLNQKQLAEKLNVTDKAVSKWETGRSAPDISMLTPLSEALGVSVVEILNGEKIEKENLAYASDEAVVSTMKKGKRKIFVAVLVGALLTLMILCIGIASYFGYHYFNSIPIEDAKIIERTAEVFDYYTGVPEIVKAVKKGDYYFYLLRFDNAVALSIFDRDRLFKDRVSFLGGTSAKEENFVELYCSGENSLTINAFIGYGMTDKTYTYSYRGVKCTKPIEDEYILDVLIDLDDSWTHANVYYD